ncbi:MAG: T9SS type A sorting domain-containing protein [bacterium]
MMLLKRLIILLVLFSSCYQVSAEDNFRFDIERMICDFYGVAFNEQIVIVFGTNGIILSSTDKGESWQQKKICEDSLNIKKMIYVDNSFFAISDNGFLLKSVDNGNNWQIIKTNANRYCNDLVDDGSQLYLLSVDQLDIYNYNLDYIQTLALDTSWSSWTLCAFKENLYLPTKNGTIISLDIQNNFQADEIVIAMYGTIASELRSKDGKLYANLQNNLYETENPKDGFVKVANNINIYQVHNNKIYNLEIKYHSSWRVSWIDFFRIDEDLQKIEVSTDSIDRFVNPIIYEFEFIDNEHIIAVGPDKTIYISTNGGETWILKSNVMKRDSKILKWLDSQIGFMSNGLKIFKTNDAGVTWKPQVFTDTLIKNMKDINGFYLDSTGFGYAISHNDGITLSDSTKDRNFMLTTDFGETFTGGFYKWHSYCFYKYGLNIEKVDTAYIAYCVPFLWDLTFFIQYDSKFNPIKTYWIDSTSILNIKVNTDNNLQAFAKDSKNYSDTEPRDSSTIYIMESTDLGENWMTEEQYVLEGDFPGTVIWDVNDFIIRTRTKIDSFYTTNFFYFNSQTKIFNKIFTVTDTAKINSVSCMKYQKELFIFDNHKHKTYSSINYQSNFPEWKEVKLSNLQFQPGAWSNDTIFYATVVRQKLRESSGLIWIEYSDVYPVKVTPKTETSVEGQIENYDNSFATHPYPVPATNIVSSLINWNTSLDIENDDVAVYDVYGTKVAGKDRITIEKQNEYNGILTWDCSNVPNGIYLIRILNAEKTETLKVIVNK